MTSILEDLELVAKRRSLALGSAAWGAIMPLAAYWTVHHDLHGLSTWRDYVLVAVVVACLLFSVRTVWKAGHQTSGERLKATCWVIGLEGLMVASPSPWLAVLALCYLIGINAIATACAIVRHATPVPQPTVTDVAREQNLPRRAAAKVVEQRQAKARPVPAGAT